MPWTTLTSVGIRCVSCQQFERQNDAVTESFLVTLEDSSSSDVAFIVSFTFISNNSKLMIYLNIKNLQKSNKKIE